MEKEYFCEGLLEWYHGNQRDLPWRRESNPYYTWVSEIMLQQTRVDTVIPYFYRFISAFPTMEDLANASEEEVLKLWEGLGYYSRARNLQLAVREVQYSYGGEIPQDRATLLRLRGVGDYTAGAILSIAYNYPEAAVDGNVMRVLSRYFLIEDDIAKASSRRKFEQLAQSLIPLGKASEFNQALMELGALVCTPKSPQCGTCPVAEHCAARRAERTQELPLKSKGKPPRLEARAVALVQGVGIYEGCILVRRRGKQGLLANMWELPHVQLPEQGHDYAVSELARCLHLYEGLEFRPNQHLMNIVHVFSHIRWDMSVYRCEVLPGVGAGDQEERLMKNLPKDYRWLPVEEIRDYPFATVFLRILEQSHYIRI